MIKNDRVLDFGLSYSLCHVSGSLGSQLQARFGHLFPWSGVGKVSLAGHCPDICSFHTTIIEESFTSETETEPSGLAPSVPDS